MLYLDSKGFLIPDQVLPCTLAEFRSVFVEGMPDENRPLIFENFLQFCRELLRDLGLTEIKIWANGSFTARKRNPNDLDVVVFVDAEVSEQHRQLLKTRYRNDLLQKEKRLDVYFVEVYFENHPKHFPMRSDMAYWIEKFTRTRPDWKSVSHKKGLLEITIAAHEVPQV
jgi:hypothetical protein